ncbi:DEAD/DEAH box helicase [Micromonospora sp. RTP1Z1]|uniref:DEAD/DEAH box helicase n=1 Tax=Micromonospora sp. RTP1Z1 TaxID=2994043 RepID=UPI0029C8B92E|nr:DEAD/DEAH box helicase [Micromonospora sp. RTP1Z1]
MINTHGFTLAPWQAEAVRAWDRGGSAGPHRGTLEIVTGGGKTLIALACAALAATKDPELRIAVVVPTEALARQWQVALQRYTSLVPSEIGLLGAGKQEDFGSRRAIVAVLNTAAKRLPALAQAAQPLMLIVDECHRAGAPTFGKVLRTEAAYKLGLSATPDREEVDDSGQLLRYDEQLVGQALGAVVYRFTLRDARLAGWLPDYDIHHHGIQLTLEEQRQYDKISRQIDDLGDELRNLGFESGRAQHLQRRRDEVGQLARRYIAATSRRKDLLYRATDRSRVTSRILAETLGSGQARRVLLFHERVGEAAALHRSLVSSMPNVSIALEHSKLGDRARIEALDSFRTGATQVLVSVKSLVEGIDVPEADVGISVASTSSVRQRIQALGRVLRRRFDENAPRKHADMHLIYVAKTVDEQIYAKEDWADLTGEGANRYWLWTADATAAPRQMSGPPASPRPTEEQEWERLHRRPPETPVPWRGTVTGQEYSVDTLGTVTNGAGTMIRNPQHAATLVEQVRGRRGGRFRVTPTHRLVLVWGESAEGLVPYVAGQLAEPFEADVIQETRPGTRNADPVLLEPGTVLVDSPDKGGGSYRLRQKQGGVIERRTPDGTIEFALVDEDAPAELATNARRVLENWRRLFDRGIGFFLSEEGQAWYVEGGKKFHLAHAPGGFAWPS